MGNVVPLYPWAHNGVQPVPLYELARYMREGRWLDMRCDNELIQRARIVEIVVRVQGEDVVLRQEWLDEGAPDDQYHRKQTVVVDSESIWKVKPSVLRVGEVKPHGIQPRPERAEDQEQLVAITMTAAHQLYGVTAEQIIGEDRYLPMRRVAMVVVYEVTDLSPVKVAEAFRYASSQPLRTACDMIRWERGGNADVFVNTTNVRKLGDKVDQLAGKRYRRATSFFHDHKPVLSR